MSGAGLEEIFQVGNNQDLSEIGGAHNQKGVEYQRHWSLVRMFELEKKGASDFLFLFEVIQDVAILDSATNPTTVHVFQVKKKERKEWGWLDLTKLHQPQDPTKKAKKVKQKPLEDI